MKFYNTLVKENYKGEVEDVVLLKDGFSFAAFFFTGLWFLYHKMWREFIAILLVDFIISNLSFLATIDKIMLSFGLALVVAFNATYWLTDHFKNKGYRFAGLVCGSSVADATSRFFASA